MILKIFWSAGFRLGFRLPLIQACFLEIACEKIYELMYLVVFIDDISML